MFASRSSRFNPFALRRDLQDGGDTTIINPPAIEVPTTAPLRRNLGIVADSLAIGDPLLRSYPSLLENLSGYWHLDEVSGNRLDRSGNNNSLTPVNNPKGNKFSGCRFNFNSYQKLKITSNATLATGDEDFSVCCWVRLQTKTSYRFFVCKDNVFNNLREWNLTYVASEGAIVDKICFSVQGSAGFIVSVYPLSPALDTYYFLCAWHDSVNNTINLQIDNGSIQTTAYTGTKGNATSADFTIGNSSDDLGLHHDGNILTAGFWKRILSAQERSWLYNNGYWLKY